MEKQSNSEKVYIDSSFFRSRNYLLVKESEMRDVWLYLVTLRWQDPRTKEFTGQEKFPICVEYDDEVEDYIRGWKSRHHQGETIYVTVNPVFDKNNEREKTEFELCAYPR